MLKEPKIISLLRAQRGRCQAAQSTLIAPCQLQTGGNFLHFFPSNWMGCKLQLFKLWKSLIVLPQEQYNKTSSRFELWRVHLCCLTLLVKREKFSLWKTISLFTKSVHVDDCHIWPNWLLTPNIKNLFWWRWSWWLVTYDGKCDLWDLSWGPIEIHATLVQPRVAENNDNNYVNDDENNNHDREWW